MGLLSQLLWEWRPHAARPEHCGRVMGIKCLRTASGWAAGPFIPCAEGWPRARRRCVARSRVPRGALERGGVCHPLEGRSATLERGGVCPAGPRGTLERGGDHFAGSRGTRMVRMLGFFESFPFFRMGSRPWAFVGPVVSIGVCVFKRS